MSDLTLRIIRELTRDTRHCHKSFTNNERSVKSTNWVVTNLCKNINGSLVKIHGGLPEISCLNTIKDLEMQIQKIEKIYPTVMFLYKSILVHLAEITEELEGLEKDVHQSLNQEGLFGEEPLPWDL